MPASYWASDSSSPSWPSSSCVTVCSSCASACSKDNRRSCSAVRLGHPISSCVSPLASWPYFASHACLTARSRESCCSGASSFHATRSTAPSAYRVRIWSPTGSSVASRTTAPVAAALRHAITTRQHAQRAERFQVARLGVQLLLCVAQRCAAATHEPRSCIRPTAAPDRAPAPEAGARRAAGERVQPRPRRRGHSTSATQPAGRADGASDASQLRSRRETLAVPLRSESGPARRRPDRRASRRSHGRRPKRPGSAKRRWRARRPLR